MRLRFYNYHDNEVAVSRKEAASQGAVTESRRCHGIYRPAPVDRLGCFLDNMAKHPALPEGSRLTPAPMERQRRWAGLGTITCVQLPLPFPIGCDKQKWALRIQPVRHFGARSPLRKTKNGNPGSRGTWKMVEMAGIEPASWNDKGEPSPCAVTVWFSLTLGPVTRVVSQPA